MSSSVLEPILSSPLMMEHLDELHRLVQAEAERRRRFYDEITEDTKWEFINGEVVMHSPATNAHNLVVSRLATLLSTWCRKTSFGQVTIDNTLCKFPRNDYEPDIVFFGPEKAATLQGQTLLHPVPDFVVEVLSPSTEKLDRGVKFQDYAAHGVAEYWIVDPFGETVEQFLAKNGRYPSPVERRKDGRIASLAVRGFETSVRAFFDDAVNFASLRELIK